MASIWQCSLHQKCLSSSSSQLSLRSFLCWWGLFRWCVVPLCYITLLNLAFGNLKCMCSACIFKQLARFLKHIKHENIKKNQQTIVKVQASSSVHFGFINQIQPAPTKCIPQGHYFLVLCLQLGCFVSVQEF